MNQSFKYLLLCLFIQTTAFGLSTDYSNFNPRYEGTYRAHLKCQKEDPSTFCESLGNDPVSIIVFNTYHSLKIAFGTSNSKFSEMQYAAAGFEGDGKQVFANAFSSAQEQTAQEIGLTFVDRNSGAVGLVGWIRNTRTRYDIQITGIQNIIPYENFSANQNPNNLVGAPALVGNYSGTLDGVVDGNPALQAYKLSIRKSSQDGGGFLATLQQVKGNSKPRDYVISKFYPEYGAVVLVGSGGTKGAGETGESKLVFSILQNPFGRINLNGMMLYSDNPGFHLLAFKRNTVD